MKVLITGASRGIGKALIDEYLRCGVEVVGVARNRPEDWPQSTREAFFTCDLSKQDNWPRFFDFVKRKAPFDICIHNVGVNEAKPFVDLDENSVLDQFQINLLFPVVFNQFLLREKLLNSRSSFIFINSLAHFSAYPGSSFYGASKSGLHSFAQGLAVSLKGDFHVLNVYPGPVETEQARANSPLSANSKRMSPQILAQKIVRAQQKRKQTLYPGFLVFAFIILAKVWPWSLEWTLCRSLFRPLLKANPAKV
ncbi:MAG: SDR family NAD(P)-dependent oxidoreductase [Bdellovibrionales bacterium]|nr:SDR family NAD(P)-dependent oxidoreductase [Bdellovibrionales bacterium]